MWVHPTADKLYCEEIDVGEEGGPRQIASGLRAHYSEEDMLGHRVLVVSNLKVCAPKKWLVTMPQMQMQQNSVQSKIVSKPPFAGEKSSRFQIAWDGTVCRRSNG